MITKVCVAQHTPLVIFGRGASWVLASLPIIFFCHSVSAEGAGTGSVLFSLYFA